MSKSIASVTSGQIDEICRTAEAIAKPAMKIAVEQMIADGEIGFDGIQRVIEKADRLKVKAIAFYKTAIAELSAVVTSCLTLISGGEKIAIKATSGKKLISQAKKVFPGWIDPDFENYGCNVADEAKPETPVQVFELTTNADFQKMFGSFEAELDDLTLTQEQIISFVEEHESWLHPQGWYTFFLFKANGKFFVARVDRSDRGLEVDVDHFSYAYVWHASVRGRVVVPQLKLKSES